MTEPKHFFTFSGRGCAFLKLNGAWIAFFLPMRYTIGSEVNNDGFSGKRKTSLRFKKGKRNDAKTSGGQVGDSAENRFEMGTGTGISRYFHPLRSDEEMQARYFSDRNDGLTAFEHVHYALAVLKP